MTQLQYSKIDFFTEKTAVKIPEVEQVEQCNTPGAPNDELAELMREQNLLLRIILIILLFFVFIKMFEKN
jgi:hypothetical protein